MYGIILMPRISLTFFCITSQRKLSAGLMWLGQHWWVISLGEGWLCHKYNLVMEVKFFLFSVGDSRGHMFLGVGNLGAHLRFRLPQFVTIQIKLGFFFFSLWGIPKTYANLGTSGLFRRWSWLAQWKSGKWNLEGRKVRKECFKEPVTTADTEGSVLMGTF